MNEIETKPLFQATMGDFKEVVREIVVTYCDATNNQPQRLQRSGRKLAYGVKGLAQILGCSTATAQRIKRSGRLNKAISQDGRVIVVDVELALELMKLE